MRNQQTNSFTKFNNTN